MRAGQPVLFWASGSRRRDVAYGVWGLGRLTGPAVDGSVPLDLTISDRSAWLSRELLRTIPALRDLEVLRQPQAANPSFVTAAELETIAQLWRP
jgi:hypothetical protein